MTNIFITALLAGFAIYWEHRKPFIYHYLLKPLTTICILAMAFNYAAPDFSAYSVLIMAGLIFSLGGDIALMLPHDRFVMGLGSFLIAQIIYTFAFISRVAEFSILLLLPLIAYGIWMFFNLKPNLGKMTIPVLIYIVCILLMAWSAANYWNGFKSAPAMFAAVGALTFVFSDSVLAWNRFKTAWSFGRPLVLGSYFLAQYLIASSLNY